MVEKSGLGRSLELCRRTYNFLLEKLREGNKSRSDIQHWVVELKKQNPEFGGVYSKALQMEPHRLFSNMRSLKQLKKNGKKVGRLYPIRRVEHCVMTFSSVILRHTLVS